MNEHRLNAVNKNEEQLGGQRQQGRETAPFQLQAGREEDRKVLRFLTTAGKKVLLSRVLTGFGRCRV